MKIESAMQFVQDNNKLRLNKEVIIKCDYWILKKKMEDFSDTNGGEYF
jgi:hypothetical protein